MKRTLMLVIFSLFFSMETHADTIFDRIQSCQDVGGGECVFDLLREVASGTVVPLIKNGVYADRYDRWVVR